MASASYPVHIERNLLNEDNKLIVVQFPAMRSQFENDPDSLRLSIKPKSLRMQMDIDEGQNIFTSTKSNIDDSQLFICKKVNNKIVCLPVAQICAMRSDFSHLNPKEEIDPREEVRPVSVKFAATDRQQTPSKLLDNKHDVDDINEEYKQLLFKNVRSKYATAQRDALFGKHTRIKPDPDAQPMDVKPDVKLIPDIKPKIEKMDVDDIYAGTNYASTSQRKSDTVRRRVKECLTKAKLVSYEEVYQFITTYPRPPTSDNLTDEQIIPNSKDILDALNEYGILVQGNWAIKSEVLYGDSGVRECTDVTGIPINLFTAARDHLLWLFNEKRIVSRPSYSKKVKLPDHDVLELFNQLATFRKEIKKWELKLPTDQKFLDSFPDVVQRQMTFWKVRKANKLAIFK